MAWRRQPLPASFCLDLLVLEEKRLRSVENVGVTKLEGEVLMGDEPKILHDIQFSLQKEFITAPSYEASEGSRLAHSDIAIELPPMSSITTGPATSSLTVPGTIWINRDCL